ncbi:hypothetical protein [Streptomyces sp. G-G2]|uniref:hypothetical protein n=1 Tax=Streptomyces sp. G-G2 TaxID=3046201 RepID=UPI0024B9F797|nr:hypothetical protein [Streptomyces sp. G-G2]MDJ0385942.1 hypothetical protein [Streptomyces sp. G-G2]
MDTPAGLPAPVRETIADIVAAVRDGDDARIRLLLEHLSHVADTAALLLLHSRLNEDLHASDADR